MTLSEIAKDFGIIAAIRYLWDTMWLKVRRRFRRERIIRFEDLTDQEARQVAWAFGLYSFDDRVQLNREWEKLDRTLH